MPRSPQSLAEALVRPRLRDGADRELRERWAESFGPLDAAHRAAQPLFPVERDQFDGVALHLVGRAWKRLLRHDPQTTFSQAVDCLDDGTFLRDLAALALGIAEPERGTSAFYGAFPAFEQTVRANFDRCQDEARDLHVPPDKFARKCFGTALYHLLGTLRASVSDRPRPSQGFGDDPGALLAPVLERGRLHDLHFAIALGQGDARAAEVFEQQYRDLIRTQLRAGGLSRHDADDRWADLIGECMLYSCTYFGRGPFAGWVLAQCRSYLGTLRMPRGTLPLHDHPDDEAVDDIVDPGAVHTVFVRAWNELGPLERRLIVAFHRDRQPQHRIAASLGRHPATVSRWLRDAAARFRGLVLDGTRDLLGQMTSDHECIELVAGHADQLVPDLVTDHSPAPPDDVERNPEPDPRCPMIPCALP